MVQYRNSVGLFRRSKRQHEAADPLEANAEAKELNHDGSLGPAVSSMSPIFTADPGEREIDDEELLASANPEDDTTRELLIERERREQEGEY